MKLYPDSPLGRTVPGIPTGREVEWEPLVDYRRFDVSETTIHGAVAWWSGDRLIHSFGGNVLCYGRSMMKPLMVKVFAEALADCTWEQKAIAVASHNGDTEHVAAAMSLLPEGEHGLMLTPLDVPLVQFGRQVRRPRRWYHCCSGEHAAILRGCRAKGWNRAGYMLPQHPFFVAYLDQIRRFLGPDWEPLRVAKDGCGLPTVSNTVTELARLYAGLVKVKDEDWIWEAMVRHPDLVGGFNRLDSTILKACGGKVIAKEGADGLLGLAIEHPDYPDGLGIVIKIAHGWNAQATWYIARGILGTLGFSLRNPYALRRQKAFLVPGIVPPDLLPKLEQVPTWDDWDPDQDRWTYDWHDYAQGGDGSDGSRGQMA
ncbi:MAG TPA: asparaginase [Holophagaceae bacterium]|nr:asparaginase [Holophagaceae bacterium]